MLNWIVNILAPHLTLFVKKINYFNWLTFFFHWLTCLDFFYICSQLLSSYTCLAANLEFARDLRMKSAILNEVFSIRKCHGMTWCAGKVAQKHDVAHEYSDRKRRDKIGWTLPRRNTVVVRIRHKIGGTPPRRNTVVVKSRIKGEEVDLKTERPDETNDFGVQRWYGNNDMRGFWHLECHVVSRERQLDMMF